VNYLAPLAEGAFTVALRIARTNRSSQHWLIEITQEQPDGTTASVLTGTAVTAVRRPTFNATDANAPPVEPPSQLELAVAPPELEWLSRYDVRWLSGVHPQVWDGQENATNGSVASLSLLWARLAEPRTMDYAALAAVADIFYPRVWLRRATRVPAGTVSMTVYFHADAQDLIDTADGFVLCQARAHAFRDGHSDQTAHIWNESGTLLATTHQLVYYKA
jgi:acyl-coenzyme A thioesterase PaaI-like protein